MLTIENIEFDITSVLVAIVSSVIVYFAWKSTNVREDRLPTAVFIIENRRRLLDNIVRQPANIVRTASTQSDTSTATEEVDVEEEHSPEPLQNLQIPEAPSLQDIIDEVNDLATTRTPGTEYQTEEDLNDILDDSDGGPQEIIEEMDNPNTDALRRRRVAFYTGEGSSSQGASTSQPMQSTTSRRENLNLPTQDSTDNSHAENCSNENNENENISKTDNKSAAQQPPKDSGDCRQRHQPQPQPQPQQHQADGDQQPPGTSNEFRIKLKYLNDELRLVKGTPTEAIGDFKKRNFTVELAAQKLVRLVFNGHVLQPDSKTLQACGLFDNCVVHCLIHNKKPTAGGGANAGENSQEENRGNQAGNSSGRRQTGLGSNVFLDRTTNGPLIVYLGIALGTFAIGFCWYCRVLYSFLFSWYSTIGLILMTVLFLLMCPLIILIERGDISATATAT